MTDVVIVSAARTALGKFNGSLAKISAPDLGATVVRAAIERAKVDPALISDVVMGNILTAGLGQNPARQTALKAGLGFGTTAYTVGIVCGSGLKAVMLGANAIIAGDSEIVVAGGQENMSAAPHVLNNSREGIRMGDGKLVDSMIVDGLWDAFNNYHMGTTAENVAKQFGISREDQDKLAVGSQNKAEAAQKAGRFDAEIVPVSIPQKKGDPILFDKDEFIRYGATLEALSKLKGAFAKDGTVTAGNASGINDGAAAMVLMTAAKAKELGLKPLARIAGYAIAGIDPKIMGMGPVDSSRKALARAGWKPEDLDLMEINEAFAAQACAVHKEMGWDLAKVNVNGGAIALGHPVGASGARILVTLLHEMQRRGSKKGLASLCIGGGMGAALAVESL